MYKSLLRAYHRPVQEDGLHHFVSDFFRNPTMIHEETCEEDHGILERSHLQPRVNETDVSSPLLCSQSGGVFQQKRM